MSTQPLLSIHEVADLLGLPVKTLYTWRTRGTGPVGFHVGRHVRYRLEDVVAWIDAQRAAAVTP